MFTPSFTTQPIGVPAIMRRVLLALVPGIATYVWFYGPAILISLTLASVTALTVEAAMLKLRDRPIRPFLSDYSALLTAWLLALSIPPLAPWWLVVVGTAFAISVAKHLYGGLGNNPFNPAMIGYAVLIISFPLPMTHWLAPLQLASVAPDWVTQLSYIFGGTLPDGLTLDALTSATPLDNLKTQLPLNHSANEILAQPNYGLLGGKGAEWVVSAFALGGLYLLASRLITWHVPLAFLGSLALTAGLLHLIDPTQHAGALFHVFSGAAMLGAFFILTDPVTGPTTARGKLIFAAGAGFLTYMIRVYGGFPDGVAFATLLMNLCVPLLDTWTQPKVYGNKGGRS